jgi:predicted dinucleotide-binding enzyme
LNSTYDGLATAPDSSSAEYEAKVIASGAKVVNAFNTTYATTLLAGIVAGDGANPKSKVAELVKEGAIRPVEVGPLSRARQIEGMPFLHIVGQSGPGTNWASTIKILS